MKIEAIWQKGFEFIGKNERANEITFNVPGENGAPSSGAAPMDVLLMALASCAGMDIVYIMKKKRAELTTLEISVEGERSKDYPKRFTKINLKYFLRGTNISEKAVAQAIELSQDKYCGVRASLHPKIEISSSFEILN